MESLDMANLRQPPQPRTAKRRTPLLLVFGLTLLLACASQPSASDGHQADQANETSPAPALLIGDEFVDFTEAPVILVDGTASDENSTSENSSSLDATTTSAPETSEESSGDSAESAEEPFKPPQNVSQYMDYIEKLSHDLRHQITDLFEPHLPQLIRTSQMVQLSGSCSYDMLRMALGLRSFEPWALRMIDSSGKVPEGIFEGSFTALGSYDECLSTVFGGHSAHSMSSAGDSQRGAQEPTPSSKQPQTQGKYCLVNVSPFLPPKPPADRVERVFQEEANRRNYTKDDQFSRLSPMFYYMRFRIGICIPSTCLDSDMDSVSDALSSSLKLNISVSHCRVKQTPPMTKHQLAGGLIFGSVLALVLAATLADCYRRGNRRHRHELVALEFVVSGKSGARRLSDGISVDARQQKPSGEPSDRSWMSFSALANFGLHFQRRPERAAESHSQPTPIVRCLNGIRVLSLCWVIVANSYITLDPRATKRLTKTREAPKDFLFQMVVQASLAIETFFFLSGLLVSLSFAKRLGPRTGAASELERKRHWLSWLRFYLHRYVRMTPATMLVIALSMFAYRFGDGPLWAEATQKAHQSCSQNWWRHLLHVSNFIDTRQMCFIHYWYIAADMQLFLFAPLLLLVLHQRRRLGYLLVSLVGVASVAHVFHTTYSRNLPPTLLFYNSDPESRREFGNTIMTKPLTHALPYMVGMLLGTRLHESLAAGAESRESIGRKSLGALLGVSAAAISLVEVFLPYKWNNAHLPTRFLAALYAALFRFAWSLALGLLVIACRHERSAACSREPPVCASCRADHRRPGAGGAKTALCVCGRGGNLVNRLLSLDLFAQLSKLSFVAYLIHLPLMSVFVGQTRGLFAFSHTLVLHLALSYLVLTLALSFVLVHVIEFPFLSLERYLVSEPSARKPEEPERPDVAGPKLSERL